MMHKLAHVHVSAIRANAHNAHTYLRYVHMCSTGCRPCAADQRAGLRKRPSPYAHARTSARRVGNAQTDRVAILSQTNEFLIRDSAKESNSDRHLATPSNHSLTAVGSCSVLPA